LSKPSFQSILRERQKGILLPVGPGPEPVTRPVLVSAAYEPPRKKKRQYKPETERLYARLTEAPRNVSLEKLAHLFDEGQRRFRVPKHLRDKGWPDSWVKAWKDKDGGFRKKLSDLRQSAWQWKLSK
jgi:hypothetical protein